MKGRKTDVRRGIVTEESWSGSGLACWGFWLLQTQSTGYLVLAVLSTSTGDWAGWGEGGEAEQSSESSLAFCFGASDGEDFGGAQAEKIRTLRSSQVAAMYPPAQFR